jgi:hypothetical protein
MRNYVSQLKLENYWSDEPKDELASKLDELIKKGQYNVTKPNK